MLLTKSILSLSLAAVASSFAPPSPPREFVWPVVARDREGDCSLAVTGNGKFFRIAAYGLGPGERGRFHLANEDMKPIDFTITADAEGRWTKFYLPFLWHHDGGTVTLSVEGRDCQLSASFDWQREVTVID